MKKLGVIVASLSIALLPSISFGAADKALDLFENPTANQRLSPDYYVGIMGGTSTGSSFNNNDVNVPMIGGAKAGVYFNKYFGIEVSGLMGPIGTQIGNQSSSSQSTVITVTQPHTTTTYTVYKVGGNADFAFCGKYECSGSVTTNTKTTVTTTTTEDINEHNVNNREYFGVTKTVTTLPTETVTEVHSAQATTNQQNQTMNVEAFMGMARLPLTYVSFYAGAGPALLNIPNGSMAAFSGKVGAEVPFGMIGVFAEEQGVFAQGNMLGMALGGVAVHF